MKRWIAVCLSLIMLSSFTACGNQQDESESSTISADSNNISPNENSTDEQEEDDMQSMEQTALSQEETDDKILIAYFSLIDIVPEGADASAHATPAIGNTESAALEIQKQVGGDLFAIQTTQIYPVSHQECSAIAEEEMRSDARPELSTHVGNMNDYNTIYIGYPIWWYMEPMAIRTFLEEYDFSGKTIIPFCTSMGAGVDESVENITALAEGATVLEGVTLHTGQKNLSEDISEWLNNIDVK